MNPKNPYLMSYWDFLELLREHFGRDYADQLNDCVDDLIHEAVLDADWGTPPGS